MPPHVTIFEVDVQRGGMNGMLQKPFGGVHGSRCIEDRLKAHTMAQSFACNCGVLAYHRIGIVLAVPSAATGACRFLQTPDPVSISGFTGHYLRCDRNEVHGIHSSHGLC